MDRYLLLLLAAFGLFASISDLIAQPPFGSPALLVGRGYGAQPAVSVIRSTIISRTIIAVTTTDPLLTRTPTPLTRDP